MDGYLRWYYGYKNFGDELLFFWIIKWIFTNYSLDTLFVEVEDKQWMHHRIQKNENLKIEDAQWNDLLHKIQIVENKQHKYKLTTHIINFLWRGKYRKLFKFFGGGEVLTDERKFPHDGRNIPLLFSRSVRKGQFVLLWWVTTPHKRRTRLLYKILFRKAQKIVIRDKISLQNVELFQSKKTKADRVSLHQDFAIDIINQSFLQWISQTAQPAKCILININHKECTAENREKIKIFCRQYPLHQKIFFPCDMYDDAKQYKIIKQDIPELIYYNWTEHNLDQILNMFAICDGGIWCRLHFLLPLKLYRKTFEAIPYAEKIEKLIIK